MAIGVYRKEQNFNAPIGVAGVSQAPTRLSNTLMNIQENISNRMFKQAVQQQEQQAIEEVTQLALRDPETNELSFTELPSTFSPVMRRAAQPVLDKMIGQQIEIDIQNEAIRIHRQFPNDLEGFETAFSAYRESYLQNTGKFSAVTDYLFNQYAVQHGNAIYTKALTEEENRAFANSSTLLKGSIRDVETGLVGLSRQDVFLVGGETEDDPVTPVPQKEYFKRYEEKLIKQIEEHRAQFPDRYSETNANTDILKVRQAFASIPYKKAVNALTKFTFHPDPKMNKSLRKIAFNQFENVLRGEDIPEEQKKVFASFGITQEWLDSTPDDIKRSLATQIASVGNTAAENDNELIETQSAMITQTMVNDNYSVSADDASTFLKMSRIESVQDFQNIFVAQEGFTGGNPESPNYETIQTIYKMILNPSQPLPQVITDYFSQDNLLGMISRFEGVDAQSRVLRDTVRMFNRITRSNNGQFLSKGFDDSTVQFMIEMDTLARSASAEQLSNAVNKLSDPFFDLESATNLALGKQDGKQVTMQDFSNEFVFGSGYFDGRQREFTVRELSFFNRLAPKVLALYGKEMGTKIIEQSLNTRFYRKGSEYMLPYDNISMYAPERMFNFDADENNKNAFDGFVSEALNTIIDDDIRNRLNGETPEMGKNVFLMEPSRVFGALPSYLIVDIDGTPFVDAEGNQVFIDYTKMQDYYSSITDTRKEELLKLRDLANQGPPIQDTGGTDPIESFEELNALFDNLQLEVLDEQ